MAHIDIRVGSVTGTALQVAQTMAARLQILGHTTELLPANTAGDPTHFWLICTSNTGMGDLPDNIQPFLDYLRNSCGYLGGLGYALVNLGDSAYSTFGQGGQALHEALLDLGATPIAEPLLIDAMYENDPITAATDWLTTWEAKL